MEETIEVGSPCSVSGKDEFGVGIVRFFGQTKFKEGLWVGIEFPKPSECRKRRHKKEKKEKKQKTDKTTTQTVGKNDGSVGGVSYFSCPPNHGMFVPANLVKVVAKV